jgi:NAD(P)-dependent dehydrogenase (short-subunit alcohol dehydrogenase family)
MSVAVVTGASRGLGLALARELLDRDWQIVIGARDAGLLEKAVDGLAAGARVRMVVGDVQSPKVQDELVRAATGFGRLDLLVNNASVLGVSPLPRLVDYPLDELEEVFRVNTVAPLALIQKLLPALAAAKGTVIDISSDAAVEAYPGWGGYGAAKAALDLLSAVLAVEQPEIRVYSFDPGDMRTKLHQEAYPGEDISDRPEPESVVPSLMGLIRDRPASGRFRASELAAGRPA